MGLPVNGIRDVDSAVLDAFSLHLQALKFALCIRCASSPFIAYAAVMSSTVHKPREDELKDYRIGPPAKGLVQEISIALLPTDEEVAAKTAAEDKKDSIKAVTLSWVGTIKDVLSFGANFNETNTTDAPETISEATIEKEKKLVQIAKIVKNKLSKRKILLVYPGMHIKAENQRIIITSVAVKDLQQPDDIVCGFTTTATAVVPCVTDPGEFDKIHVCPFMDTIPQMYEMDIFRDALSPFFSKHPLQLFAEGDVFQYNSVEFKVVSTQPASLPPRIPLDRALSMSVEELVQSIQPNPRKQRVGPSTAVCLGYPILPHWIDILDPARQHIVMSLPAPIQSIVLINFVSESGPSEIERVMLATEAKFKPTVSAGKRAQDLAESMRKMKVNVSKTMEEEGVCMLEQRLALYAKQLVRASIYPHPETVSALLEYSSDDQLEPQHHKFSTMNVDDISRFAAQYVGLASSVLTLILGIVHISYTKARISWPHGESDTFISDVQKEKWRQKMFTFEPNTFFDLWLPILFGLAGVLAHLASSTICRKITSSYGVYFIWLLVQALFANFGYRGGLGILVGTVSLIATVLAMIAFFFSRDKDGSIAFKHGMSDAKTQVGRGLHLAASILTFIVGLIHVFQKNPKVKWPDNFIDDVNQYSWRSTMFSLAPVVFIDNWTAVVLGLWGILGHMKGAGSVLGIPTFDFLNAGLFLIVMGLWGTIAYAGGIGIIFSGVTFLGSLVCLILAFIDNQHASFELA